MRMIIYILEIYIIFFDKACKAARAIQNPGEENASDPNNIFITL